VVSLKAYQFPFFAQALSAQAPARSQLFFKIICWAIAATRVRFGDACANTMTISFFLLKKICFGF
jgi:hypothetical protein